MPHTVVLQGCNVLETAEAEVLDLRIERCPCLVRRALTFRERHDEVVERLLRPALRGDGFHFQRRGFERRNVKSGDNFELGEVVPQGAETAPELFQNVSTWCIVTYTMDTLGEVVETLGGAKVLKDNRIRSFLDLDRVAHLGVPFRAFDSLVAGMNEPESTVANGIGIGRSTLNRRREQGRFALDESQRVIRLGVILTLGKRALGSVPAASRWLLKPNRALGGRVPLELLQTEFGSRQVEAVLGRALYGGYS